MKLNEIILNQTFRYTCCITPKRVTSLWCSATSAS